MRWNSQPRAELMPRNVSYYKKSIANSKKSTYTPIIKNQDELIAFLNAYTEADVRDLAAVDLSTQDLSPQQLTKLLEWHPKIHYKLKKTGSLESLKRAFSKGYVLSDIKMTLSDSKQIEDFLSLCERKREHTLFASKARLDLSGTQFSAEQFKRLLAILEENSNIRHLVLNDCGIKDEYFMPKAKAHKPTTAFKHLRTLALRDNALRAQQVVREAKDIIELDLSGNAISEMMYLTHLDQFLKESGAKLKRLRFEHMKAGRMGILNLWLSKKSRISEHLRELDLRGSNPALGFIESLHHNMTALRSFALSDFTHLEGANYANGKGSLLDSVLSIEHLEKLTLQNCKLTSAGLNKIFATNGIRQLDLSKNPSLFTVKATGSSGNLAPASALKWQKNAKLRVLHLNECTVREEHLQKIIENFPGLRKLGIASSNTSLEKLVALVSGLSGLKSLDLRNAGISGAGFGTPTSPRRRKPGEIQNPSERLKPLIDAFNKNDKLKELHISDSVFVSRMVLKDFLLSLVYVTRVNGMCKAKYIKQLEHLEQLRKMETKPASLETSQSRTQFALKPEEQGSLLGQSESTAATTVLIHPSSSTQGLPVQHSTSARSVQSDAGSSAPEEGYSIQEEQTPSLQVESSGSPESEHTQATSIELLALIKLHGSAELIEMAHKMFHSKQQRPKHQHSQANQFFGGKQKVKVLQLNKLGSVPESSQEGISPK